MSERTLYFLFNEWTGLIKVGIANDVANRLETLECAAGVRLQVLSTLEQSADLEKPLHQALFATREVGEWFRPSADLVAIARAPSRESIDVLIKQNLPAVQAHLADVFAKDAARREAQMAVRNKERERKFKEAERKRLRALKAEERKQVKKAAAAKLRREELKAWRESSVDQLREQGLTVRPPVPESALLTEAEKQRKRNQQLIGLSAGVIQ